MSVRIKFFIIAAGLFGELILQLFGATPVRASECSFSEVARYYNSGLQSAASGRYSDSLTKLMILAKAGFGPAQREVSKSLARGLGAERSRQKAALWAELAFRSGDMEGRELSQTYRMALAFDERQKINAAAEAWAARTITCKDGGVIIDGQASSIKSPLTIKVRFNKLVKREDRLSLTKKINNLLDQAVRTEPSARLYLGMIDEIEIYQGSRYHRYLGWQQNSKRNILRFASSNLDDIQLEFMAKALIVEAKRRAFALMSDADFIDPHMRQFNGIYFFGSAYPDINNERYFDLNATSFCHDQTLAGRYQSIC